MITQTTFDRSPAKNGQERIAPFQHLVPELSYSGVKEAIYSPNHPDVTYWTDHFTKRFKALGIFETFDSKHPGKSYEKSVAVGVEWHRFSEVGPWFECQAAAMVTNNHVRHFIIQVAFEELGMRDETEIHPDLFWDAMISMGIPDSDRKRLSKDPDVTKSLDFLATSLLNCKTDAEILGMLLGLELPARENIETVFHSAAYTPELENRLSASKFFKIHRHIEVEHIRLSVANFLRFCTTDGMKKDFIQGCDLSLRFWQMFWQSVSTLIEKEQRVTR